MAAIPGEDPIDLAMAQRPDATPPELRCDPPAVPVGQQADRQDESLEGRRRLARPADPGPIEERRETALGVARPPAEQARPAAAKLRIDRTERLTVGPTPVRGTTTPDDRRRSGWTALSGGRPPWVATNREPGPSW